MKTGLEGRVALVTGGSQGIGRAIASALAAAGAHVVLVARREDLLSEAVADLEEYGIDALGIQGDVRDPATIDRMVNATADRFGRFDVLVNNAGASYSDTFRRAPLLELDVDDLRGAIDLNVGTAFACSKAAVSLIKEAGGGSIVNVASIVGEHPMPGFGFYSPAKAALVNLTRLMALEWAPHVRVNAVLPGHIDTPRSSASRTPEMVEQLLRGIAMRRLGTPEDVAGAVVYLASDLARWTTGAAVDVNGGMRVL